MSKVLIVEDDSIIREGLQKIVKELDHTIEIYATGYAKEGLNYAKIHNIDLFLFDIQLLDHSGMVLAEKIRNMDRYKLTPIVFITAVLTKEMMAFKDIHCYDYIIKPFEVAKVKEVVGTIIKYGINKRNEDAKLSIKQKGYTVSIFIKDIIYAESTMRKIQIKTVKEVLTISSYTLSKLQKELPSNFIRCHKGFIVNSDFIEVVDKSKQMIRFINDYGMIPYGEKYKSELKEEQWL